MEDGKVAKDPQSRAIELEGRLIDFAVRIFQVVRWFAEDTSRKHIADKSALGYIGRPKLW